MRFAKGSTHPTLRYRTERNARANTTSHPTMTTEVKAPAVILAFSFGVYPRIQRLGSLVPIVSQLEIRAICLGHPADDQEAGYAFGRI
jgi:hypothetical protein